MPPDDDKVYLCPACGYDDCFCCRYLPPGVEPPHVAQGAAPAPRPASVVPPAPKRPWWAFWRPR